jgi:hypothetical protein
MHLSLLMGLLKTFSTRWVDFETAQDLNAQSPDFVNYTVHELYRERHVPMGKTLDQYLIDENLALLDKLIRTTSSRSHVREDFLYSYFSGC